MVDLEDRENKALRDPDALLYYILERIPNQNEHYYVLLDEVQLVFSHGSTFRTDVHRLIQCHLLLRSGWHFSL